MRHFQTAEELLMRFHELAEASEVSFARKGRIDYPSSAGFQVLKNVGVSKWELGFISIQDLKEEHFVAMETELLETERDFFRWFEQVGEKQNDAPPMDQPNRVLQ